jgi:hypothetical protein
MSVSVSTAAGSSAAATGITDAQGIRENARAKLRNRLKHLFFIAGTSLSFFDGPIIPHPFQKQKQNLPIPVQKKNITDYFTLQLSFNGTEHTFSINF